MSFPYLGTGRFLAFAHRGADPALENTMPAFERAVSLGYRYLETDVWSTTDGVLLAFHDDTLARTTDARGRISSMRFDDVRKVRVGGRALIPAFEDVLASWPDVHLNVDVKHDGAVEPLLRIVRRTRSVARLCVGSFSQRRIEAIRDAFGPKLCTALGPVDVVRLMATARGAPVGVGGGACAQVPVRYRSVDVVEERFLEAARRCGIPVHVWTVNEAREMHRLIDLGVDGLMTDDADTLRSVLVERGLWKARELC